MVPWESDPKIFGSALTGRIKYIKTEIPPLHMFQLREKNFPQLLIKHVYFLYDSSKT